VDYEERTLYSTWNVSFHQVRDQNPAAAEILKLMAYLDNQDIWYNLFQCGASDAPAWWVDVLRSRVRFNRAISILCSYSLLEVSEGQYSLHTCVHDWILKHLNRDADQERCKIAIRCVAASVSWEPEAEYWVRNQRVLPHVLQFQHVRLHSLIDWSGIEPKDLGCLAYLYEQNDMRIKAEEMYVWALRGYEKEGGAEHTAKLDMVNNLGNLYADQGKMAEAEEMYVRALQGYEKAWGPEHKSTLDKVNNLGNLYADQSKMAEAEEMLVRALRGYEKAWAPEHTSTLGTVNNLANLRCEQGKLLEAEQMYQRALTGLEKVHGPAHVFVLGIVNNLGVLFAERDKHMESKKMYRRALDGFQHACGAEHSSTVMVVNNLSRLALEVGENQPANVVEATRKPFRRRWYW
jgi:tetratricopeptide (TPR) repeat protein